MSRRSVVAARGYGKILRAAAAQGVDVTVSRSGHLKLRCPNGALITASASPSDSNAYKNLAKDLRRYGNVNVA
jgi:hypothetical protein